MPPKAKEIALDATKTNENENATNPATEQPATPIETRTPERIAADAAFELKKAESIAKVKVLTDQLLKAEADAKKWAPSDDEDSKEYHDYMESKTPGWYQRKLDLVAELKKDIADEKLNLLSPREKECQVIFQNAKDKYDAAQKEYNDAKAAILLEFPNFFGAVSKSTTKEVGAVKPTRTVDKEGVVKPFTGTLLPTPEAEIRVKSLHESGMTSERDIIREIYGDNFTISGSAVVNIGNGNPRSQIHAIREKLGYTKTQG